VLGVSSRKVKALCLALLLCQPLAVMAEERAFSFVEIDRLYFHRDQAGNLKQSTELLRARLKAAPEDAEALWRLCRSEVRWGERKKKKRTRIKIFTHAEQLCERAVAFNAQSSDAAFWFGLALGRRGQARGILRSLFMIKPLKQRMRRVIELDPQHGGAHHVLGQMLMKVPGFAGGDKEEGVRELLAANRLSPNFTATYPALAEAYIKIKEREKAVGVLRSFYKVKKPADPADYAGHRRDVEELLKELGVAAEDAEGAPATSHK
jgi:tetratricopeptide (TPR) repeat protein